MARKGSSKGKGKARAKMPTSVINRCLSLDRDRIKAFILEHIRGLIRIYNVCGVRDEWVWDLLYDIIFLDPVTTCHFSQFQMMWPAPQEQEFAFSGVVGYLPLLYGANAWQNPRPNEQLQVGQPPCLRGSSRSLQSADNQLGEGQMHRRVFLLVR